jgi:excisionase family DNA binding protein
MAGEKLLTPQELSESYGVPLTWIYQKAAKGVIPSFRLGRYVRFRAGDVEHWLEGQRRSIATYEAAHMD